MKLRAFMRALSNSAPTPTHLNYPHPPPPTENNASYSSTHPPSPKIMSHPPKITHTHSK